MMLATRTAGLHARPRPRVQRAHTRALPHKRRTPLRALTSNDKVLALPLYYLSSPHVHCMHA